MRFQQEDVNNVWEELQPLLTRHWQEVAATGLVGALAVDAAAYRRLQAMGALHLTTARLVQGGELVGYAAYILSHNLHYSHLFVAEADVFYLAPEWRRGWQGLRLLQAAESGLRAHGVALLCHKVKAAHDCGALFRRMGYTLLEHVYVKGVK